jgi:hypothetical protein
MCMYMFNVTLVVVRVYKTYSSTMFYAPVYDRWVTTISNCVGRRVVVKENIDYENPRKLPG